jgi:hypothetical protein
MSYEFEATLERLGGGTRVLCISGDSDGCDMPLSPQQAKIVLDLFKDQEDEILEDIDRDEAEERLYEITEKIQQLNIERDKYLKLKGE